MKAKSLINSLDTIARYERGEVQLRAIEVVPPTVNVRSVRDALGMSQKDFASRFGFSLASVRNWEQGVREPEGPARILLALIQQNPSYVERELHKMIDRTPNMRLKADGYAAA
jgi:putative transcriptional regulator